MARSLPCRTRSPAPARASWVSCSTARRRVGRCRQHALAYCLAGTLSCGSSSSQVAGAFWPAWEWRCVDQPKVRAGRRLTPPPHPPLHARPASAAMDESNATCGKRLESIGLENTVESRQAYRELLVSTPGLGQYISGERGRVQGGAAAAAAGPHLNSLVPLPPMMRCTVQCPAQRATAASSLWCCCFAQGESICCQQMLLELDKEGSAGALRCLEWTVALLLQLTPLPALLCRRRHPVRGDPVPGHPQGHLHGGRAEQEREEASRRRAEPQLAAGRGECGCMGKSSCSNTCSK